MVWGIVKIAFAALVWGAAYPLTKLALTDVPPLVFGFLRFFLAGLVFVALTQSAPLSGIAKEDKPDFIKLAFWGVFVLVLGMNYGLIWAPGIVASVISATPPLFTVLLAAYFFKERIQPLHIVSIILAVAGCALLGGDLSDNVNIESYKLWIGSIIVVVPQFAWAMYSIIGKKVSAKYDWRLTCRDSFMLGSAMLLPGALLESAFYGFGVWQTKTLAVLIYLVLMNSVITYALWNSALKIVPVTTAAFLIYLQPVSGAIISYVLFEEKLNSLGLLGTGLIFVALILILSRKQKKIPELKSLEPEFVVVNR